MMKKIVITMVILVAIVGALAFAFYLGQKKGASDAYVFFMRRDARNFGPSHDYFHVMADHAKEEDIPILLDGLKLMPDSKEVCFYGACIAALNRATGASPGDTYQDWTNWWATHRNEPLPAWHPAWCFDTNLNAYIRWKNDPTKN